MRKLQIGTTPDGSRPRVISQKRVSWALELDYSTWYKQKTHDSIGFMNVIEAIQRADSILPGHPVPDDKKDPRWQAIIAVGEFVEDQPEQVWAFVERWGKHPDEDLRAAIATCLLEHLLEFHFGLLFPRVEHKVRNSKRFADTFSRCAKFGQSGLPNNSSKFERLMRAVREANSGE